MYIENPHKTTAASTHACTRTPTDKRCNIPTATPRCPSTRIASTKQSTSTRPQPDKNNNSRVLPNAHHAHPTKLRQARTSTRFSRRRASRSGASTIDRRASAKTVAAAASATTIGCVEIVWSAEAPTSASTKRVRCSCKTCGGSSVCEHQKQRGQCRLCSPGKFCAHNRRKSLCKICGGSSLCEHLRQRGSCKNCTKVQNKTPDA